MDAQVKDLLFFDKMGRNYGFVYDENTNLWSGSIFIDSVSMGLFETEKIVLLQRYLLKEEAFEMDGTSLVNPINTYTYGKPSGNQDECYVFEWDDSTKEVDEIRLYGIEDDCDETHDTSSLDYNEYTCPRIEFVDSFVVDCVQVTETHTTLPPHPIDPSDQDSQIVYGYEYTYDPINPEVIEATFIDICFCNVDDQYNTFRRDLMLYKGIKSNDSEGNPIIINKVLVGVFNVYAESLEEDERLTTMCENLGYDINNADFSIFKDTDIKEQLIDYDFINQKRKEILMEGHNIYPYIGSYKSVLNAIRFFGYDNVSIKEWWKNVNINSQDYGKYFLATSYSLEDNEVIKGKNNITLPNKNFRKLPKITLAYKINSVDKTQDAASSYHGHGYPQTNENFTYTIEEAVIKLYGLKRKLDKEFLPLSTRIVDIVGEADAFYANILTHVATSNMTENAYIGHKVDFDIENGDEENTFYLEDLRPFGLYPLGDPNCGGDNMVGESSDTPHYIGDTPPTKSLITANPNPSLQELGLQNIYDMNTNYEVSTDTPSGNPLLMSTPLPVGGDLGDIAGLPSVYPNATPPNEAYPKVMRGVNDETKGWDFYTYYLGNLEQQGLAHTNYYLAHFSDYYPNLKYNAVPANTFDYDSAEYLPDTEDAVSGALVRLVFKDGEICSRIKWDIYKGEDETPEFHAQIFGMFSDGYGDIGVVLPYVGTYDVVMTVYGFDNSISVKTKQNCIRVEPKNVEFTGWCVMARQYCDWNTDICWDDANFEWRLPIINGTSMYEIKSASYESMDRATFIGDYIEETDPDITMYAYEFEDAYVGLQGITEPLGYGARLVSPGPYYWNNISECSWDDLDHLWWDAMCISGDLPAYIEFGYFDMGGNNVSSPDGGDTLLGNWLEIVGADYRYGSFKFPSSLTGGLTQMSEMVRLLNESDDPVISRYHYSWVYDYTGNGNGDADIAANEPLGFKIVGVAKSVNRTADILYAGVVDASHHATAYEGELIIQNNDTNPQRGQFRYASNTFAYNPNWMNCVFINNVTRIPRYTDVNFNYSNCRIVGKKNPRWKITNLNTGTVYECDKKNFHRLFRERGCYEVSLTLNDNNGNTYNAKRNILIIE